MRESGYLILLVVGAGLIMVGYFAVELWMNASTSQAKPVYAELNNPFELKLHQRVIIQSENLSITFFKVLEDSRCPENSECVWEGRVVVLLRMEKDELTTNLTLSSSDEVCELDEVCVKFLSIEPRKKQGEEIKPQDYVITLIVTKAGQNENGSSATKQNYAGFCGFSTYGECAIDQDCVRGGCSGQVCQSKFEERIITTCEWRECYDADRYGVECRCIENKCQWYRG